MSANCKYDKSERIDETGYPKEVGLIISNKCSVAGCHNTQSAGNAGGLDFTTWDKMFEGGRNGSAVIPYSVDYSFMLYFTNTYLDLGIKLEPTMPYSNSPLSRNEVLTLRNWIANGAPNSDGFVKFSDNPNRKKFYVCMQGCDQVAVFDAETRVIMRYVKVGVDDDVYEGPHDIGITPDGKYWAMAFISGHIVQFFNTSDDKLAATVDIGAGFWNIITFTPDSKTAFVSSTDPLNSKIAVVDITTFTHSSSLDITGVDAPHGMNVSPDSTKLYVTSQYGNHIWKIDLTDYTNKDAVFLDGIPVVNSTSGTIDPHQIDFSPDGLKYFISCQASNDVRVFRTSDDSLLATIPVGTKPQEMEFSESTPYLYLTCTEDPINASEKGSVYIINYQTNQVVKHIYPGFQPHGIDVDDDHRAVYVANLNYDANGPAPHHTTGCGGRNGYITIIDMNTQDLLNITLADGSSYLYKNEVLPFPYEVAYRK